ncbi:MAG: hypothetical protein IID44_16865 [Planctomycetes bacterium]|nr:hypothetical protein [Planctomycetota bacterium]
MLFRKNHGLPAGPRPLNLNVLYILAAAACSLWAARAYALHPDVWPPPFGRFDLFDWWPMYASFVIVAVIGFSLRWGFVIPCTLLGKGVGDILNFFVNPAVNRGYLDLEPAIYTAGSFMFFGVCVGLAIGVILDRRQTEPPSP